MVTLEQSPWLNIHFWAFYPYNINEENFEDEIHLKIYDYDYNTNYVFGLVFLRLFILFLFTTL